MISIASPTSTSAVSQAPAASSQKEPAVRYLFIDGLRGIAALGVLFHHLLYGTSMEVPLKQILPLFVEKFCSYGCFGVNVFFVLSGFVIAYSLRQMSSQRDFAKFILRRQLRLDPPYWCVLFFCVAAAIIQNLLPGLHSEKLFSMPEIAINLLYLQGVTKVPGIVGGSWTLCLEIQFYILYAVMMLLGYRLEQSSKFVNQKLCVSILVTALALFSLYRAYLGNAGPWFIDWWFYFASGVLCYRVFSGTTPAAFLFFTGGLILLCSVFSVNSIRVPLSTSLATAAAIYLACRLGTLGKWLAHPVFQYFGRISYSLYLVNILTAWTILRIGFKISGNNPGASLCWFIFAAIISVGAANLLYLWAEKPSLAFSGKVKARLWV